MYLVGRHAVMVGLRNDELNNWHKYSKMCRGVICKNESMKLMTNWIRGERGEVSGFGVLATDISIHWTGENI